MSPGGDKVKKTTYNKGDVIKIDEKFRDTLALLKEQKNTAKVLMVEGAVKAKESDRMLWALVNELYPELEKFHISLNHNTLKIYILGGRIDE